MVAILVHVVGLWCLWSGSQCSCASASRVGSQTPVSMSTHPVQPLQSHHTRALESVQQKGAPVRQPPGGGRLRITERHRGLASQRSV